MEKNSWKQKNISIWRVQGYARAFFGVQHNQKSYLHKNPKNQFYVGLFFFQTFANENNFLIYSTQPAWGNLSYFWSEVFRQPVVASEFVCDNSNVPSKYRLVQFLKDDKPSIWKWETFSWNSKQFVVNLLRQRFYRKVSKTRQVPGKQGWLFNIGFSQQPVLWFLGITWKRKSDKPLV